MSDEAHAALFAGHEAFVDEDYTTALNHYTRAASLQPTSANILSKLAAVHLKLGDNKQAVSDATRSVELEPSLAAHRRVGLATFALGAFTKARAAFESALEHRPDSRELKRWVRKCDAELASPGPSAAPTAAASPRASATATTTSGASASAARRRLGGGGGGGGGGAARLDASKVRHDWYQTDSHVIVSIFAKNIPPECVLVDFSEASTRVRISLPEAENQNDKYELTIPLWSQILPSDCSWQAGAAKVELKMGKREHGKWEKLEGDGKGGATAFNAVPQPEEAAGAAAAPRSVYSGSRRDWAAIETDVKRAEEEETPEGEEALNKLFRDIYGKADEATRRAMNKSYQTSGGTVLSTNWSEVGEKDYEKEREAPAGQEWKKYG